MDELFSLKLDNIVIIYVFNVLLVKNISTTKKSSKSQTLSIINFNVHAAYQLLNVDNCQPRMITHESLSVYFQWGPSQIALVGI